MQPTHQFHRSGAAAALAALLIGAVLGTAGCGDGTGTGEARASQGSTDREPAPTRTRSAPPTRPAETEASRTRPPTSAATQAAPDRTAPERTAPTRAAEPAETTTQPRTSAAAAPGPAGITHATTGPAGSTTPPPAVETSASAVVAATTTGIGPAGWLALLVLGAALVVGVLLIYRSQRKAAWDAEARSLETETRALTGTPLSSLLIVGTAGKRSLTWPALRTDLTDLADRWNTLSEQAAGDQRRSWSAEICARLRNLIAAVDAENEAMALGDDWTTMRPHVRQAQQSLAAVLTGQPSAAPPPAGEPGPSAFQS